jgi:eukaryotic-like serine/threonine-protein kinase
MSTLPLGTLIADRFEIEEIAGSGGMGTVFRAKDRLSQRKVALKLLHSRHTRDQQTERFAREGQLIAELSHPGIVAYVAHGQTLEGEPFLAMEWLDGEDLAARLKSGPLRLSETLTLLRRIADALSTAHLRGIVHRDLKPSNLFLRDGKVEQATILDFGIARPILGATTLTRTGVLIGTPGYMAPEQARGERELGPSADIFSLGCVLYECLTGEPPFVAEHLVALLAKILFDAAPKVRDLCPELPEAVGALLDRTLAKEPSARPSDAMALLSELSLLTEIDHQLLATTLTVHAVAPRSVAGLEQQLFSVVIAVPPSAVSAGGSPPEAGEVEPRRSFRRALESALTVFHAWLEWLADGSLIAALSPSESATDLATQAARCALLLQQHWPAARIALATGRGVLRQRFPVGDAVDRAARIVRALPAPETPEGEPRPESMSGIWLDELSADLLDGRFALSRGPHGTRILGDAVSVDDTRLLLGRPTPCVGREQELGFLESILNHCIEESVAQVVLVTAAPGIGKSRLRHEFVRRLEARGPSPLVLLGRGDLVSKGSPYGLVGQALRRLCGVQSGDTLTAQQAKLQEGLRPRVASPDAPRIIDFLGEMCGVPSSEEPSERLRAARADPKIMSEQVSRAFVDWLRIECARCPVLLVLEDLHWGDALTVNLVDAALRDLPEQPLLVLALARPDVKDLFPRLFGARALKEIALGGLSKKASERLVQRVLDKDVTTETMARIVEQAAGNALYLEELVRAVAEGKGDQLPDTVLSMLQVRLSRFSAGTRRVLRSASVFGGTFWRGGVRALLAHDVGPEELDGWLRVLVDAEVIEWRSESRFPSEAEYRFRHALMREAAYSMLTEQDATLGHRLASVYLEGAGERDPMILAEHAHWGGDPERAVPLYLQATEQAFACNDWEAVKLRAERGVACGAAGEDLGALRLIEAEAHVWRGDLALSEQRSIQAIELLTPGSAAWFRAIRQTVIAAGKQGGAERVERWVHPASATKATGDARSARILCLSECATQLIFGGRYADAHALIEALSHDAGDPAAEGPQVAALLHQMRAFHASATGDPGACLAELKAALVAFEQAGDLRDACVTRSNLGFIYAELGDFEGAEQALRGAAAAADRMGLYDVTAAAFQNLGRVLAHLGRFDEARRLEEQAMAAFRQQGNPRMEGFARAYLAQIALLASDFGAAERDARAAIEALSAALPLRAGAGAVLAQALLGQGRAGEALVAAREAFALLSSLGSIEEGESLVRLVYAEALAANGEEAGFIEAIVSAREQLLARAARISDPAWRERFLSSVPENARTLELARAWKVELSVERLT